MSAFNYFWPKRWPKRGGFPGAWLLLACALTPASPALGLEAPLRINTASVEPFVTPQRSGFLDLLLAEVGNRIGRPLHINLYKGASARSLEMANSGMDDGEALRIVGQEARYPNLVRIPESIIVNDFVAYSRPGGVMIGNFQDLRPTNVGHIIGWWIFQRNLEGAAHVTTVRGADQLFSMLKLERIDYALYEKWQGLWVARSVGVPVRIHEPPLAQTKMFMYLHRKHTALVPEVAKALVDIKRDGTFQGLMNKILIPLLPR